MITGYGPEVDPAAIGHPIQAFVMLELAQGRLAEAVEALEATPEVLEADAISGPQDLICRVAARDTEHLQEIVNRLLADRRDPPLDELHRAEPPDPPARAAAGGSVGGGA